MMGFKEQLKKVFDECWRDNFGESSDIYQSDLKEKVLALVKEHCVSKVELQKLLKNLRTTLNDKKFSFSIGHVGLAEGKMQVIDIGFVKKFLEMLEGLLKK